MDFCDMLYNYTENLPQSEKYNLIANWKNAGSTIFVKQ
ncbi:MAG: hypothetical protein H0W61_17930 [Bacteroidetes bacterium]|nr:hypothetical protein [Bacteroidota bacterium]